MTNGPRRAAPPTKRRATASNSCGSTSRQVASAWKSPWTTAPALISSAERGRLSGRLPFGETRSYAWLARAVGSPHATRAIGRAVGSSPNLIFVPCHRIVGSRGLGGYARGISVKRQLLDHEEAWPRMRPMLGPVSAAFKPSLRLARGVAPWVPGER